ncbi:MAG: endonuclease [Alphaproteobacteria bacterium]|nr:endonuclease [Alphaproteobacteria bacterium]
MRFSLATFNVENLDSTPDSGERDAALRPLLEQLDADVLCLQEVNAQGRHAGQESRRLAALDRLLAGSRFAGYARIVTLNDAGTDLRDVHNLVILSRFPVLRHEQIRHRHVPPPAWQVLTALPPMAEPTRLQWDRPLLLATLELGLSRPLHVLNLHLRAPLPVAIAGRKLGPFAWSDTRAFAEGCCLAEFKRAAQALEARLAVDALFDADPAALIAVAGDYNAGSLEAPTVLIACDAIDTGNPALAGRALRPVEARLPAAKRFTVRHGGEALMLDHLLVSNALAAGLTAAEVLNEGLADELLDYLFGRRSARGHHAPVVARFDLAAG